MNNNIANAYDKINTQITMNVRPEHMVVLKYATTQLVPTLAAAIMGMC